MSNENEEKQSFNKFCVLGPHIIQLYSTFLYYFMTYLPFISFLQRAGLKS